MERRMMNVSSPFPNEGTTVFSWTTSYSYVGSCRLGPGKVHFSWGGANAPAIHISGSESHGKAMMILFQHLTLYAHQLETPELRYEQRAPLVDAGALGGGRRELREQLLLELRARLVATAEGVSALEDVQSL